MLLELGLAVGGGLLNAFAGAEEDRQREKQKQQALALLRENIIDPNELDSMLRDINKMFNSRLINTLNSTAIRSRGVANQNVVKGIVAGQVEGARLGSLTDTRFRAMEQNKSTYSQMAGIEAGSKPRGSVLGEFTSGTLTALPAVLEASKYFSGMNPQSPELPDEGSTIIGNDQLDESGMFDDTANYGGVPWNTNVWQQFRPTQRGF